MPENDPEPDDADEPDAPPAEHDSDEDVPPAVVDEVERLTRLARDAIDENEAAAYREERDALAAEYDFRARVRDEGARDTLVLYPEEWLADGLIQREEIEDIDRGIERPLESPGPADDWAEVESHNRAIVDRIAAERGEPHVGNVTAFADFMSNHYARAIDDATDAEVTEFLEEYYPRNAWPTESQREAVEESLALAFEVAESIGPD